MQNELEMAYPVRVGEFEPTFDSRVEWLHDPMVETGENEQGYETVHESELGCRQKAGRLPV
jgi:hypothetical protein